MALTTITDVKRIPLDRANDYVLVSCIVGSVPAAGDYVTATTLGIDNCLAILTAIPATAATAGVNGVAASGTLTFTVAAAGDTETCTVGDIIYTFETGTVNADWEVDPGADQTASAANLANAINGVPAATHQAPYPHPLVSASAAAGVLTLTARSVGTAGNSIALDESGTNIAKSGTTLTGGVAAVAASGPVVALPNTQTDSATQDDAGDVFLKHGHTTTQGVRLVVIGTTPGN